MGRPVLRRQVGAGVVMGFSGQRLERRSRAKALNYGKCGGGRSRENVAQGFNPAAGVMLIGTPIAKEAGGRPGCHGIFEQRAMRKSRAKALNYGGRGLTIICRYNRLLSGSIPSTLNPER